MNGIEKITARIEGDTSAEVAAILREAETQAARIRAGYEARSRTETEAVLAKGERAAQEREERLVSMVQLECRKAVLAAKQKVIDQAFDAAKQKLLTLPEAEYTALLAGLAAKASSTGKETLIFSQADRARVGKAVAAAAKLPLAEETRPMDGGFILSGGDVEVNCTFDTLVRLQRDALAGEVAKVLFE